MRRDGAEAELRWSALTPTRIIADHAGGPDALRATGAGAALIRHPVETARAEGLTVALLCPFVAAKARRHPESADGFTA